MMASSTAKDTSSTNLYNLLFGRAAANLDAGGLEKPLHSLIAVLPLYLIFYKLAKSISRYPDKCLFIAGKIGS